MLDVTRLRVLAAVARHGSVTAAARALNYAQPSVSHHLARLEAETGARLVQRAGRGIQLTDAGRLLAARAEEILGRLEAAEQELASHMGQRAERIRLAGFPTALATLVPAVAARLHASHPGVELLLAEAEPATALRMLRGGHVDVALVYRYLHDGAVIAALPDDPAGTRESVLLSEPVYLVMKSSANAHGAATSSAAAGAGHAFTTTGQAAATAALSARAGDRWIAGREGSRAHLLWQCELAGFTPQIAFTTDDVLVAQALAAAGLGVTLLPGLALRAVHHRGIHAQRLPGARREVLALTYGAPPDPPPVADLLAALTEVGLAATDHKE